MTYAAALIESEPQIVVLHWNVSYGADDEIAVATSADEVSEEVS